MFTLNKEVSRTTADIDSDDVLNTKKELNGLGYYKPDEKIGMNKFTDESLFSGIGKFQQDNKLKVDEIMKPGGETEAKINEFKQNKKENISASIFGNKDTNFNQNFRKTYEMQKQVSKESEITKALSNRNNEKMKVNSLTQTAKPINTSGLSISKGILNPSVSTSQNRGVRYAQATTTQNDATTRNIPDERFESFSRRMSPREGGFEDRPTHIEHPTNMGIRQDTLDRFRINNPELADSLPNNIRDITREQTDIIYYQDYYRANRIGDIEDAAVAEAMYDFYVNHSPNLPRRVIQEAINQHSNERVTIDGDPRQITINALNRATRNPETRTNIINHIFDERVAAARRETRPDLANGVVNRVERLRNQLLQENNN